MNVFGKIWLKDGTVLEFKWQVEFFAARGFYERKGLLDRAVHTRW